MSDKGWKARERRVLRKGFATERIPVTGERDGADGENAMFCVQVKNRQRGLPAEVREWLAGICGTAERKGKIGVLVVSTPRQPDLDAVVCLTLRDWIALHGETS